MRSLFNSVDAKVTQRLKPLLFVLLGLLAAGAQAHGVNEKASLPQDTAGFDETGCAAGSSLAATIAARYAVTLEPKLPSQTLEKAAYPSPAQPKAQTQRLTWYFYRSAQQIALLKGSVDEVWYRDAQNRISYERVLHADARVVDYSTGELATLNVKVDWAALSCFVDPSELAQLKQVSRKGKGPDARWRLRGALSGGSGSALRGAVGTFGKDRLTVDWSPALQLPLSLTRQLQNGTTVRMELLASAPNPPPDWPQVGVQSAHYLHLDAADFGDMDYDPVVRKSEALDIRSGWRAAHRHD